MADNPTWIRALQVLGITTSGLLSGMVFGISRATIPSLLLAPSPLIARQWQTTFDKGKATAIPAAAISSLSFAILAYNSHTLPTQSGYPMRELYASAAVSTLSMVPFTILAMSSVNSKLMAKAAGIDETSEVGTTNGQSDKELVDWWGLLNFVRGFFPLTGSVLGLWAALN